MPTVPKGHSAPPEGAIQQGFLPPPMPPPALLPPDPPGRPVSISAVVFDLGGVLIDWDPRHLYRKLFPGDEPSMEAFLADVCSVEWNALQDAGRPWREAVDELVRKFPAQRELIAAYDRRWSEMLGGAIDGTVQVLAELRARDMPLYALSNWSTEKFALARPRYPFLEWFRAILISGDVGVAKPDERIFRIFLGRHGLDPARTVYIDDVAANVAQAAGTGMLALRFRDPRSLRADLVGLGLLDGAPAP